MVFEIKALLLLHIKALLSILNYVKNFKNIMINMKKKSSKINCRFSMLLWKWYLGFACLDIGHRGWHNKSD